MNKVVITGAGGSVGSMLVYYFLQKKQWRVHAIDRSEIACFRLIEKFRENPLFKLHFADIRDESTVREAFRGADIAIHCAAAKRVDLGNIAPESFARENVESAGSVARLVNQEHVLKTVFCSTDKAATPTSVLGASKLLIERVFSSASNETTRFASIRFGNILNSTGSIIERIGISIRRNVPVIVTSPQMTRYVMTSSQVLNLISLVLRCMKGGEVFIPHLYSATVAGIVEETTEIMTLAWGGRKRAIKQQIMGNPYFENEHERMVADYETQQLRNGNNISMLTPCAVNAASKNGSIPLRLASSEHCLLPRDELSLLIHDQLKGDGVI